MGATGIPGRQSAPAYRVSPVLSDGLVPLDWEHGNLSDGHAAWAGGRGGGGQIAEGDGSFRNVAQSGK